MYDFTYVGNVAHSHLCADRALASEGEVSKKAAGEILFCFLQILRSSYPAKYPKEDFCNLRTKNQRMQG
ncbi:hypothetical protein HN51_055656 [Arachis hypogaea]